MNALLYFECHYSTSFGHEFTTVPLTKHKAYSQNGPSDHNSNRESLLSLAQSVQDHVLKTPVPSSMLMPLQQATATAPPHRECTGSTTVKQVLLHGETTLQVITQILHPSHQHMKVGNSMTHNSFNETTARIRIISQIYADKKRTTSQVCRHAFFRAMSVYLTALQCPSDSPPLGGGSQLPLLQGCRALIYL